MKLALSIFFIVTGFLLAVAGAFSLAKSPEVAIVGGILGMSAGVALMPQKARGGGWRD